MDNEEIHSFYFKDTISGVEHDYRITENETHFGIEKDGVIIAKVRRNEDWEQISGEPLPLEVLNKIYDRIKDHYE
jgi:hypothetical protein